MSSISSGSSIVTLGEALAGEDLTNNWISTNNRGYLKIRGVRFNYAATAGATEKAVDMGVNAQSWSIKNNTASVIWVAFAAASITVPANDAASTSDLFPIDAMTSADITFYAASAANQIRIENVSAATGDVYVLAMGNS